MHGFETKILYTLDFEGNTMLPKVINIINIAIKSMVYNILVSTS